MKFMIVKVRQKDLGEDTVSFGYVIRATSTQFDVLRCTQGK